MGTPKTSVNSRAGILPGQVPLNYTSWTHLVAPPVVISLASVSANYRPLVQVLPPNGSTRNDHLAPSALGDGPVYKFPPAFFTSLGLIHAEWSEGVKTRQGTDQENLL